MRKILKKVFVYLLSITIIAFMIPYDTSAIGFRKSKNVQESTSTQVNNNYPIVMMHGLLGWGNDEMYGINYWGGKNSLRKLLTKKGYTVYTPTIGSISSNWDRACELYAYIKGGTVDYGEAHSDNAGHARFGRTYPGVYKEWGDVDANGNTNKVHLIGHSMGGETIRVLAQLLENGYEDEINYDQENISPLFTGDKHWIHSIMTIATPHDGSQEAEKQTSLEPYYHNLFALVAANGGTITSDNPCLDLKMDQWGLKKQDGESYESYYRKVFFSNIWKETKDLSLWDLSLEGAKELNSWVKAQDDIYYFSIACVDTHKSLLSGYQIPNINMKPLLIKSAVYLGSYTNYLTGKVKVDSNWWRNDGMVSVRSAIGPHEGSNDEIVNYNPNTTPQIGAWNYMGELYNVDHIEVVGQLDPLYRKYLQNKFFEWADMLAKLPK